MNDPYKLALDQALADLEDYAKGLSPDLHSSLREIINNPTSERIRLFKTTHPEFPGALLENLHTAASAINSQAPQETQATNEEKGSSFKGIGVVSAVGAAVGAFTVNAESQERKAWAKAELNKVLKREAIAQMSENRTGDAYKLSEEHVFKMWCNAAKIKDMESEEAKKFLENENFRNQADERFIIGGGKGFRNELERKILLEKTRVYENPEDDPVFQKLNKLMLETYKKQVQKSKRQKEKDPEAQRAKNDILGVFLKELPDKANEYGKWHKDPTRAGKLKNPYSWLTLRDLANFLNSLKRDKEEIPFFVPAGASQPAPGGGGGRMLGGPNSLPQRGGRALGGAAGRAAEQMIGGGVKQLAMNAGRAILAATWPYLIAAAVILFFIALLVVILGGDNEITEEEYINALQLSKSVSVNAVPNFDKNTPTLSRFTYNINTKYSAGGVEVTIEDPIPDNADFVSAGGDAKLLDEAGNETTDTSLVRSVVWMVDSETPLVTGSYQQLTVFDQSNFSKYGYYLPPLPVVLKDGPLERWKSVLPQALRVANQLQIDVAWIGMWAWRENQLRTYAENCDDIDSNPNTTCYAWNNWQVGYGSHIGLLINYIPTAIEVMHPGESVQQVGQKVLDGSKIEDPWEQSENKHYHINRDYFPDRNINDLIAKAGTGTRTPSTITVEEKEARFLLATLMKDEGIGAYLIGAHFRDMINANGSGLASHIEAYGSTYNRQSLLSLIKGIYDAGISTTSPQELSVTLQPKPDAIDTYIINRASAVMFPKDETATESGQVVFSAAESNCAAVAVGDPIDPFPSECTGNLMAPTTGLMSLDLVENTSRPGYYFLPHPSPGDGYVRGWRYCDGKSWGNKTLVETIVTVATKWKQKYPQGHIVVWDLAAGSGHITHLWGNSVDITATTNGQDCVANFTNGSTWRTISTTNNCKGVYNQTATIELGKMFIDTGAIRWILFADKGIIGPVNSYAAQVKLPGYISYKSDHSSHFHVYAGQPFPRSNYWPATCY